MSSIDISNTFDTDLQTLLISMENQILTNEVLAVFQMI